MGTAARLTPKCTVPTSTEPVLSMPAPSSDDRAPTAGAALDLSLPGLARYIVRNPATSSFFARHLVQACISAVTDRVPFNPSASTPDQRRLVAQRLTRSVIGGAIGIGGPVLSLTEASLRKDAADAPGSWLRTSPKMTWILRALAGYFVSDAMEILWARYKYGCPIQGDLLVHHVMGMIGFAGLFGLEHKTGRGHLWAGISLSGEALTLITGSTFFLTALPKGHPWRAMLPVIAKFRVRYLQ